MGHLDKPRVRVQAGSRPAPAAATAEPASLPAPVAKAGGGWTLAASGGGFAGAAFGTYANNTGVAVGPYSSLASASVFACVKVLSEDVAKLPVRVRRAQHAEGRVSFVDESKHPLNRLLRTPNRWQTPFEFWSFVVTSHQLWGNAYVVVRRGKGGAPQELIPLRPDRVQTEISAKGGLFYRGFHPVFGAEQKRWPAEDVLHIRGMSLDGGFLGMSPIAAAQDSVGLALVTQKHAAKIFSQGTMLTGVLSHPAGAAELNPEAVTRMAESWQRAYAGSDNAHRVAFLEEGTTYTPIGMNAADAQLLESRRFSAEEICRIYRVPPHKIGILDKSTFSNIEQQEQSYVSDALLGICRRVEEACERDLLFDDERDDFQVRFDFSEMLRGDTLQRMQAYQIAFLNGFLNQNEIRARENMPPIEGGDQYRVPANTVPMGTVPSDAVSPTGGKNDAADNPETQPA